ncbi:MAG TPA: hypothetical protein PLK82_02500 [Bacteroidales bacterium]|nr:hypothetical protein [Bacteroidales bacterium]
MLKSKTLLLFLLKASLIYGILALPWSVYDEGYGNFYRKYATSVFGQFRGTGFVLFDKTKEPAITHVNLGNKKLQLPNGSYDTKAIDINTRIHGYLPTVLLIALVLASPVPWRRKFIALGVGLVLTMALITFKQWIALLWLCDKTAWLDLTHYTGLSKKLLAFTNTFISASSFTIPYFVVGIWLLVTFRLDDLKSLREK